MHLLLAGTDSEVPGQRELELVYRQNDPAKNLFHVGEEEALPDGVDDDAPDEDGLNECDQLMAEALLLGVEEALHRFSDLVVLVCLGFVSPH